MNLQQQKDEFKKITKLNDNSIKKIRDLEFGKERRDKEIKTLKSSLKDLEEQQDRSEELYDKLFEESDEISGDRMRAEEDLESLLLSLNNDKILDWHKGYYLENDKERMKDRFERHGGRNQYSMPYAEGKNIDELTDRLYTELFDFEKIRKARKPKKMTNDEMLRLRRRVRGGDSDDDSMDKEYDIYDKEQEIERLKKDLDAENPFYDEDDALESKREIKKLEGEIKKLKGLEEKGYALKQPSKSALFTRMMNEIAEEEKGKQEKIKKKKFYSSVKEKNVPQNIVKRLVSEFPDIRDKGERNRDAYLKSFNKQYGEGLGEEIIIYVLGKDALEVNL
tara:strand:- start:1239 stop:2246 length:1008 start_codon:yes stop_codon:yes gene_type:complete